MYKSLVVMEDFYYTSLSNCYTKQTKKLGKAEYLNNTAKFDWWTYIEPGTQELEILFKNT